MLSIKVEPEDVPTQEEERRNIQEGRCSKNTGIDDGTLQVSVHMDDDDDLEERSENGIAVVIKMKDSDHEGTSRKRGLDKQEEAKDAAETKVKRIENDHMISSTVTTLSVSPEAVRRETGINNNVARMSALHTEEASTIENAEASFTEPSQEIMLPQSLPPTLPVRGTDVEMTRAQAPSHQDGRPRETNQGLIQNTSLSEDARWPKARTFGEEFAFMMKSLIDRFEYERDQENMTLKKVFQDCTEKLLQENITLRREVQDVKKQLHQLERKLTVTRQTSGTKGHLHEKVRAGITKRHAKAPMKSSLKHRPLATAVEDRRSSSQSQQGMVELVPGSGVHITQLQMKMLQVHAATKTAQKLLRLGLLVLFTKEELKNGCAMGIRTAHNKGTSTPSTPLNPVKLATLKEFVLEKYKRKGNGPALEEKEMNRIINCKCSEIRRMPMNIK